MKESATIVVAGGTGDLGKRIVKHLLSAGVKVRVLSRSNTHTEIQQLAKEGAEVVGVDYKSSQSLEQACRGASCVISALSGVRDVIVDTQKELLMAAVKAGVPRFIPSDFCIDYRPLKSGANRNLDLRKEFSEMLNNAPIQATSVLNGMFTDLLLGVAPVVLFKQKRIFFWCDPDQKMDFTTIDDTARYTALAAVDDEAPRYLQIAGDVASMRDIRDAASNSMGHSFKFLRPGGLGAFKVLIRLTKTFAPGRNETFQAWQGMQYLYDMLSGVPKFERLDNNRYAQMKWETIDDVLERKKAFD